jgi:hypothetical protein
MDDQFPPLPPLPLGDQAGVPADADTLRGILHRHRRRQVTGAGLALAVVLLAGGAGGFAIGHSSSPSAHGTQVAAGTAPTPSGGQPLTGYAAAGAGQSGSASAGMSTVTFTAPPSTQLLVRDASDGVRVRLYKQDITVPRVACPAGATCPQPAAPVCGPVSSLTAEVSDDQVAGQTGGPLWASSSSSGPLDVVSVGVVGPGEPQPILVVVAQASAPVANVKLTTPDGTDAAAPTGGWVALAVQLPADFPTSGSDPLAGSTLVATDSSGTALASQGVSPAPRAGFACAPCAALGAPSKGATGSVSGGGAVAPTPAPLPCQAPCPAVAGNAGAAPSGSPTNGSTTNGSTTNRGAPNIAMCVRPPGPGTVPGASGGGGASAGSGSASSGSASSGSASSGQVSGQASVGNPGTASSPPASVVTP